jgi:DegV family protein with EDD domain
MKIIIDTTCQLEPQRIKDLDLHIVDYPLYLNGEEYEHYWDTPNHRELKDKYIELISDKKSKGSTSGITEEAFIKVFESCKDDEILLIIQSLSNTKATGSTLKKVLKEHPEYDVKAFDTEILASGVGAQGLALLREMKKRKMTRDECYVLLEKNRANAHVVGVLYDLFYLHRSGRTNFAKAAMATAMGLYPILSSTPQSGILKSTGKVRNFKQANARFIDAIKEQMEARNSKILTVTMAYSKEHNKECLHMKDILEKTAKELNWDIQVDINYTNFSLIPHMGPDFYEIGYVVGT